MISNPLTVQRSVVPPPTRNAEPVQVVRVRRHAIAVAVVLAHALGLYVAVHQSAVSLRLEAGRSGVRSVEARLVAAPAPQPPAPQVQPQPELKQPPKPQPPKPTPTEAVKPAKPKRAPVLASHAPSSRAVDSEQTQQARPDAAVQPTPAAPPAAQPAPPAAAPSQAQAPDLLASPKPISAGELQQLGCQIPSPDYPAKARRLQQEGTVVVGLTIDTTGAVSAAQVVRSSGSPMLDAAAVAAIRAGRCHPYQTAGIPRAVQATQPIAFNLND